MRLSCYIDNEFRHNIVKVVCDYSLVDSQLLWPCYDAIHDHVFRDLILIPLPFCYRKKQINVSFSCVCPAIDNEFRHNTVKAACFDLSLIPLPFCYRKKQINVSFSCVCPIIVNEFRHNSVKVVCGYCLVDSQLLWPCYDAIHDL